MKYIVRWYVTRTQIVEADSEEEAETTAEFRVNNWSDPDETIEAEEVTP